MKGKIVYKFGDEVLKQIEEFPDYAVSNKGFVYTGIKYGLLPDKFIQFRMKTFKNKYGYHTVQLSKNGKRKVFFVHRLVAQHFIPNPKNYRYVKHKDGDKNNNSADNLFWTNVRQENSNINPEYIINLIDKGMSIYAVSKKTGISPQKIMKILGKRDILSITISPYLKRKLIEISEKEGKTISSIVEDAIKEFLKEEL